MQDFIQFVASQPQDKKINHYSWHSCAIGEFAKSMEQLPPREVYSDESEVNCNPSSWSPQMDICIDSLQEIYIPNTNNDLTLYDVLGAGEITPEATYAHESYEVDTYGGLHDLVKWCIKEQ